MAAPTCLESFHSLSLVYTINLAPLESERSPKGINSEVSYKNVDRNNGSVLSVRDDCLIAVCHSNLGDISTL